MNKYHYIVESSLKMTEKTIRLLLDIIPKNRWNMLSNIFSRFSIPHIKSPIKFSHKGFYLKEYSIENMNKELKEKFLLFCYPADMHNREKEIKLDHIYWNYASTFIVFNQSKEIVGCLQFVRKTANNKIPVEYAYVSDVTDDLKTSYDIYSNSPDGRSAEIYRCRRSFELKGIEAINIVYMLFKAAWSKVVQTGTEYVYITYNLENRELRNLYSRKLYFQNPGINVQFGNTPQKWGLLIKDCRLHEEKFASLSKAHFILQTWFRKNNKKKNLIIPKTHTVPASIISEKDTILFTEIVQSGKSTAHARKEASLNNQYT